MSDTVRVLITGGSGFIGINLVEHYLRRSVPVLSLDIKPPRKRDQAPVWRDCDVLDGARLRKLAGEFRPTHLLHVAARTDLDGASAADYPANSEGVSRIIETAAALPDLRRVMFFSSRMVCRIGYEPRHPQDYCPSTAYGESKVDGELRVHAAAGSLSKEWLIVRPTSIWGPWFEVPYRTFFDAVAQGRYLHPRGQKVRKSFGYVGNTVHQIDRLLFAEAAAVQGRTFYLCDGPLEVRAFAEDIRQAFGAPPVRELPLPLLRAAARCGDLLKKLGLLRNPPLTSFRLENLLTSMLHDVTELDAVCGAPPVPIKEGVAATVAWMSGQA